MEEKQVGDVVLEGMRERIIHDLVSKLCNLVGAL